MKNLIAYEGESGDNVLLTSMHKYQIALFALSLCLSAAAFSQSGITDPGTLKICAEVKNTELPKQDQPTPAEKAGLASCVSRDLYYGIGGPADPVEARKCAYAEMEQGRDKDWAFSGKSILIMLYANGQGVPRNFDAAMKLACESPGAPGDLAGTVNELARMKKARVVGKFSICDHSSGPYLYKQCAILDYRFDHADREKQLDEIAAKWSSREKKAFATLRKMAVPYFKAHADNETDLRYTQEVHEIAFMERDLLAKVKQLEAGDMPKFSPGDFAKDEATVKLDFAKTQAPGFRQQANITSAGIKQAQQDWIRYRDAWVKFGKKKYPRVSEMAWKAWLTRDRLGLLDKLLH